MTGFLRPRYVPQLEGNRLRLHVERKVFGGRPGKEIGRSWLTLCPGSIAGDHDEEATVDLPLEQHAALAEACAAFNRIMDAHERSSIPETTARSSKAKPRSAFHA